MRVPYNRQVGKKPLILGFLTLKDIPVIVMGFGILAGLNRFPAAVVYVLLYLVYGMVFRLGKPPGYDRHFFRNLVAPKARRPGHLNLHHHIQQ